MLLGGPINRIIDGIGFRIVIDMVEKLHHAVDSDRVLSSKVDGVSVSCSYRLETKTYIRQVGAGAVAQAMIRASDRALDCTVISGVVQNASQRSLSREATSSLKDCRVEEDNVCVSVVMPAPNY